MASDMFGNQQVHAGEGVSTCCRVYNATGDTVKFITNYDWNGHIEGTYPQEILNGRWGVFQHGKTTGESSGSSAGVVYRGKNRDGSDNDWMLAWSNPGDRQTYRRVCIPSARNCMPCIHNIAPFTTLKHLSYLCRPILRFVTLNTLRMMLGAKSLVS